jgi:NMD protein affecting ribosome stability and mRNA decay
MAQCSAARVPLFCHRCGATDTTPSACIENNEVARCGRCGEYMSTTHWADDPNWVGFHRREERT